VTINGKKVNIPSFMVSPNDIIALKEKSRKIEGVNDSLAAVARRGVPSWLELDQTNYSGKVKSFPDRQELTMPIQEQLIVELYSK
jgi:small subunit ribosomal protein S4